MRGTCREQLVEVRMMVLRVLPLSEQSEGGYEV
jgi:hypothetical protein